MRSAAFVPAPAPRHPPSLTPAAISRRPWAAAALALAALVLSAAAPAAEPPKPHHAAKLLVVNDDGFSAFHSGRYQTADDLRRQMLSYRDTQVAVMEWCVIAGSRSNYPSTVTELIGDGLKEFPRRGDQLAHETLRRFVTEGVDTLQVVAAACHEAGVACYASLRMNGDYAADMWGGSFPRYANSTFWWDHPEYRLRDARGKTLTKLSFAFAEVRDFKLRILREVAQRDIDGINLDFQRHPDFFGHEAPMAAAFQARYHVDPATVPATDPRWTPLRYEQMTLFVRAVRALLDEAGQKKGRHLGLSVRIDWQKSPLWGCDVATWLQDGLLDYLVVGQYGKGGYTFDLAPFVALAKGTGCAVLFGEEAILDGHDRTAEEDRLIAAGKMVATERKTLTLPEYRARAARWYAAGADGIHLFNESDLSVMRVLGTVPPSVSP
ncbi:MAG: family 10 glycosylhydrolase [Verrucomicrobia bacterium]|nr:family 10 glycosylhydrolase [Verrucomicrobiota bacterium]